MAALEVGLRALESPNFLPMVHLNPVALRCRGLERSEGAFKKYCCGLYIDSLLHSSRTSKDHVCLLVTFGLYFPKCAISPR